MGIQQYSLHDIEKCLLCYHWYLWTRRDCVCSIMAAVCSLAKERKPLLLAFRFIRSYHDSKRILPQHKSAFFSRQCRCARLFMRRHIWSSRQDDLSRALSDAEKIVGYPTSFLNLRYLLSDEISNIAMYMKRFAMSKHPMLRTARGFVSDENHTLQTRGLLVLAKGCPGSCWKKKSLGKRSGRETWHSYRRLDRVSLCEFQQWRCYATTVWIFKGLYGGKR